MRLCAGLLCAAASSGSVPDTSGWLFRQSAVRVANNASVGGVGLRRLERSGRMRLPGRLHSGGAASQSVAHLPNRSVLHRAGLHDPRKVTEAFRCSLSRSLSPSPFGNRLIRVACRVFSAIKILLYD